jgi:hypothetical protein
MDDFKYKINRMTNDTTGTDFMVDNMGERKAASQELFALAMPNATPAMIEIVSPASTLSSVVNTEI